MGKTIETRNRLVARPAEQAIATRDRPVAFEVLATQLTLEGLSDHVDVVEAASIAADVALDTRLDVVEAQNVTDDSRLDTIEANFTTKLVNLGALVGAADKFPYFTGLSTWALADLTPYARTFLAVANAAAARTNLGLGAIALLTTVTEVDITLANNATNNVSITKHGFTPILPNDATKYLDGTGAWSVPAGGGGSPPAFPTIASTIYERWKFYDTGITTVDGRISVVTGILNGRTFVQATAANRPRYYPFMFNGGVGCAFFNGTSHRMTHTPAVTKALPFTIIAVIEDYLGGTGNMNLVNTGTIIWFRSGGNWVCYNGTVAQHTTSGSLAVTAPLLNGATNHPVAGIEVFNGASSVVNAYGTEQTISIGTAAVNALTNATVVNLCDDGAGTGWARVKIRELVFIEGAITLAERNALITFYAHPLISGIPSPI